MSSFKFSNTVSSSENVTVLAELRQSIIETWNLKESLYLLECVLRSGDENWFSVSRAMKQASEIARPTDWFSQKNCALQYNLLIEQSDVPKRKRGDGLSEVDWPAESVYKKLKAERIIQLKNIIDAEETPLAIVQKRLEIWKSAYNKEIELNHETILDMLEIEQREEDQLLEEEEREIQALHKQHRDRELLIREYRNAIKGQYHRRSSSLSDSGGFSSETDIESPAPLLSADATGLSSPLDVSVSKDAFESGSNSSTVENVTSDAPSQAIKEEETELSYSSSPPATKIEEMEYETSLSTAAKVEEISQPGKILLTSSPSWNPISEDKQKIKESLSDEDESNEDEITKEDKHTVKTKEDKSNDITKEDKYNVKTKEDESNEITKKDKYTVKTKKDEDNTFKKVENEEVSDKKSFDKVKKEENCAVQDEMEPIVFDINKDDKPDIDEVDASILAPVSQPESPLPAVVESNHSDENQPVVPSLTTLPSPIPPAWNSTALQILQEMMRHDNSILFTDEFVLPEMFLHGIVHHLTFTSIKESVLDQRIGSVVDFQKEITLMFLNIIIWFECHMNEHIMAQTMYKDCYPLFSEITDAEEDNVMEGSMQEESSSSNRSRSKSMISKRPYHPASSGKRKRTSTISEGTTTANIASSSKRRR